MDAQQRLRVHSLATNARQYPPCSGNALRRDRRWDDHQGRGNNASSVTASLLGLLPDHPQRHTIPASTRDVTRIFAILVAGGMHRSGSSGLTIYHNQAVRRECMHTRARMESPNSATLSARSPRPHAATSPRTRLSYHEPSERTQAHRGVEADKEIGDSSNSMKQALVYKSQLRDIAVVLVELAQGMKGTRVVAQRQAKSAINGHRIQRHQLIRFRGSTGGFAKSDSLGQPARPTPRGSTTTTPISFCFKSTSVACLNIQVP
ncbi:hypothetical protein PMIN07_011925, partial [Paraphaeosphaeria minitans]